MPKLTRPKPGFLEVTFLAGLVLLLETVFFHVVNYLHDFYAATSVIAYAVLGIGLGAFFASRVAISPARLFPLVCLGTTGALYLASCLLVSQPDPIVVSLAIAATIFFPVLYVAAMFRNHPGGPIYFFDMAGAFAGVACTVALFAFLSSEEIILLFLALLPLLALTGSLGTPWRRPAHRWSLAGISAVAVAIGAVLLALQSHDGRFNIYKLVDREAEYEPTKIFNRYSPEEHLRTYDGLVGRVDVLRPVGASSYFVAYNGFHNDNFGPRVERTFEHFQRRGIRWPIRDNRVLYGLQPEPRFFIIGSAADGILKSVKSVTRSPRISAVEIVPSIVQIMTRDYHDVSGDAYDGLTPQVGNALSILKQERELHDVVTLINTHSGFNIGTFSGPDYLHTAEHYDMYFDRLDESGYILFEERPWNRDGELGLYRMIHTLWHVLRSRGAEDPSRHFMIWEWMLARKKNRIVKKIDPETGHYRDAEKWYVGMIVCQSPLTGQLGKRALDWYHKATAHNRLSYLKGVSEIGEWKRVFGMIETEDFSPLAAEGFDESIITLDRPFPAVSRTTAPKLERLVQRALGVFLALLVVFLAGANWKTTTRRSVYLSVYNILLGLGYFLLEIVLIEQYVNIFTSPALSLVLVLGGLLISSGIGGLFLGKLRAWQASLMLLPAAVAALHVPHLALSTDMPILLIKACGIASIAATGFLMGYFFPRGLVLAAAWKLEHKIPHMFAINSVAGSAAVILALYLGVVAGYHATAMAALVCYGLAGASLTAIKRG